MAPWRLQPRVADLLLGLQIPISLGSLCLRGGRAARSPGDSHSRDAISRVEEQPLLSGASTAPPPPPPELAPHLFDPIPNSCTGDRGGGGGESQREAV